MRDETYCFVSDVKDRKRTAAGAKYKVRGGGRSVKLPADYLTKKEVAKLSGACNTYPMSKPVVWHDFRAWPDDIKREYFFRLISLYDANDIVLGDMLGVHPQTVGLERRRLGVKATTAKKCKAGEWERFLRGEEEEPEPDRILTEDLGNIIAGLPITACRDPKQDIFDLIRALAGTGAKLTIEVTL